jgi:glycosyltransferase involved in cell wall biosynthesis
MPAVVLVVPGRLETLTGGYQYDRCMSDGLARLGWSVEVRELDGSFPYPTPAALAHAARALSGVGDGARLLVDGLALGAMPGVIEHEAARLRIAALVHLPIGADVGLDPDTASRLEADERRALGASALVIATGAATRPMLARYGIPPHRIVVVEPGTARAPLARGSGGAALQLLSVATLNPGKGHEILLEALAAVPAADWHLTCAGSLTRHPATVERVRAAIRRLGLEDRVTLLGELDAEALGKCYDRADVFVLATRQETYGMAVAEALARGLPVVSTTTGAIAGLVGDEAGLLAPPGDAAAFAGALARVLGDREPGLRARLAEGARRVRARLRSWEQAVAEMAAALERLDTHG